MANLNNTHDAHVNEYLKHNFDSKVIALANHLNINPSEVCETYDDSNFEADGAEYMVLTDSEADAYALDYIRESVWAFNASFLSNMTDLPESMFEAVQDQCERGNDAILQCIEQSCGLDRFAAEAMSRDGRGHFMSSYDGEENEELVNGEWFYIYRTN